MFSVVNGAREDSIVVPQNLACGPSLGVIVQALQATGFSGVESGDRSTLRREVGGRDRDDSLGCVRCVIFSSWRPVLVRQRQKWCSGW